jgi:hypothetical protein
MTLENRLERRRKFRIQGPIPVNVCGIDSAGTEFDLETFVDNISVGGLHIRLGQRMTQSAGLSFVIRFPVAPGAEELGMQFSAKGVVRRVEPCPDGSFGIGVEFTSYRQIYE